MAEYLEIVQWYVRPASLVDIVAGNVMGPTLEIRLDDFTSAEMMKVIKHLRSKRAAGPDKIPAELWKVVVYDEDALQ